MRVRWPRSPKSSSKAWSPARRCSATPERTILTTGWEASPARTFTPSPSCSPAMLPSVVAARSEHDKLVAQCEGVEVLSALDLEATPPFDYAHDHFGYRDRLSQPVIEGTGEVPTPGTGAPLKPGEFILGYPDEDGPPANLPQPEILSRNGSYHGLSPTAGACGQVSRFPARARQDTRRTGVDRGEAHGTLAQRRTARTGARERRSRS